jgi:hypothetical protein
LNSLSRDFKLEGAIVPFVPLNDIFNVVFEIIF